MRYVYRRAVLRMLTIALWVCFQQWDERLASVAQKWALQCVLAHDEERKIPGKYRV